jgi:hypothetical protein
MDQRQFVPRLWIVIYAAIFIILLACYAAAAFPHGDDADHLLYGPLNHALPQSGWIANRVIDAFFNRYLFLLIRPVDYFFNGANFFQSFAKYTGFINAAIATCLVALVSRISIGDAKVNSILKASILACCLSLTLRVMSGDTTHAIAYNLTTLVTIGFVFSLQPISTLFSAGRSSLEYVSEQTFYALIPAAYFTAFGLEIYMLFAWAYIFSFVIACHVSSGARSSSQGLANSLKFLKRPNRFQYILFLYAGFSATSLLFLLRWSGRTGRNEDKVQYSLSSISDYFIDFIQSFAHNRVSIFFALTASTIAAHAAYTYATNKNHSRFYNGTKDDSHNNASSIRPLVFFGILNGAYLAILFVAGHKDNQIMVASYNKSLLFLSPLLYINLALFLRCIISFSERIKVILPLFALGSLLLVFSFSFHFLSGIRDKSSLSMKVSKGFEVAVSSQSDIVKVPLCIPNSTPGNGGYPIFPSETAQAWYKKSYNDLFRVYYNKHFSPDGPIFVTIDSMKDDCQKES